MSGSIFGKNFTVTTWGESHGKALGVVIDGCPAGVCLDEQCIQADLDKRKPGQSQYSTKRNESDRVEILSGVFDGKTTGTPISLIIYNTDQRSKDYSQIKDIYRPGHADYVFDMKYGFRDYRGGGRSSGRETVARVAAGAVAKKILREIGIYITAYTYSIGSINIDKDKKNLNEIWSNPLAMPDADAAKRSMEYLDECIKNKDSAGGVVECTVTGMPIGTGEPVFDKLDACIAKAMFSIGAVKGVEFGRGFDSSKTTGYVNNDPIISINEKINKLTNNSGGVSGGISDGGELAFKVAFKPTPSISKQQTTINTHLQRQTVEIHGRHDPIIVPRAVIVVEAMSAIVLVDLLFAGAVSKIENIKKIYI